MESREEAERLASIEETATARIAELEASLEKLHQDNVSIKEAAVAAEGAAQGRLSKVTSQLEPLQSAHYGCERKVWVAEVAVETTAYLTAYSFQLEERDAEILHLKEECKKLIQMHRKATEAALSAAQKAVARSDELEQLQSQRDELSTELITMKASYETLQVARAQEQQHIVAEVRSCFPCNCIYLMLRIRICRCRTVFKSSPGW